MATKAVSTTRRRRRNGGGMFGRKVSVAVLAGFIPGISWSAEAIQAGNWQGAGERLMLAYTGIRPSPFTINASYLGKGLYPLIFALFVHAIANRTGLNRALGKFGLPVEI